MDTIPSIRYEYGNFLIPENGKEEVIEFLEKNNASYRMWRVIPEKNDITEYRVIHLQENRY